ncbi:cytochrome P450 734A4-like isoform X2 [Miscanthus floridulus]|uniref:cytochrome P450 734A4-like isoform X2 n=1 Tax=Miscanthus floridulus TaxID=154761 RepID=UPI00345B1E14
MEMEAEAEALGQWWTWNAAAVAAVVGACLLLLMHVAARVADALWWRPRRLEAHFARQGVRGPPYRFLLGCVTEMVALMAEAAAKPMSPPDSHDALPRVLAFYHYWRKIYGPMFLIWFGPTPRLTVADPELVREVLLTHADAFDRYEAHPIVRKLEGHGLISLHDDKWALHRRVLTPAFYPDNLNRLAPHVGRSVAALAERWRAMASAAPRGEVELDVAEWYQAVAEEAIARATFGRSYDSGRVVFRMQARLMAFASEAFRKVFVPGYRFLPTKKNRLQWSLDREIRRGLVTLIGNRSLEAAHQDDDAAAELNDKGSNDGFRDLLGFMINANDKKTKKAAPAIPVEDMLEECKTFFFAGKQTTTNLLTWATVLLAMHPDWQERARQEVLAVCGADELPSKEHLPKLKTLGMILNETLRLYPPAVATIRRAMRDVTLGGVSVPRGTELLIPIMAMHHDAALWGPDATQFNPARFARGGASKAASHPLAFIPFGLGPRMCIGQNLALLEAKLTLAVVLQRFQLARSPSYVHAPTVLMLLYPQYGAPVIFRPVQVSSRLSTSDDGASTTGTMGPRPS